MQEVCTEQTAADPLSRIVELSEEVRAYRESMGSIAAGLQQRQRKAAAMIDELEEIVKEQEGRLVRAVERFGVRDAQLQEQVAEALRTTRQTREKLETLRTRCAEESRLSGKDAVDAAAEAVREQAAYALEVGLAKEGF